MIGFKQFRSGINETVEQIDEAKEYTVTADLIDQEDFEQLTDLMNHIGVEADSMEENGSKIMISFENRRDAQTYAKELDRLGITKQTPKVK